MDAEVIRDYALSVSGLLVKRIGGPSVRPYQPPGVWEAVAMPGSDTRDYREDAGEGFVPTKYVHVLETISPSGVDGISFNAPSREVCTVRRETYQYASSGAGDND